MRLRPYLTALAAAGAILAALPSQAHVVTYQGSFAPEALGATGTGTLRLEYNDEGHTLLINAVWSGLSGLTTTAHIHCCTANPNTGTSGVALAQGSILPGFPLDLTSGSYTRLIDLTQTNQFNAGFLAASGGTAAGAEARLMNNLASRQAYFNIHTSTFGGGEIRAFVSAVPEPGSLALVAAAAGMALAARRYKRV